LIVGGGIAGCIAAISLIEFYEVTLIDKLAIPKEKIGESLAPAAQRILKKLNLLDDLEQETDFLYKKIWECNLIGEVIRHILWII